MRLVGSAHEHDLLAGIARVMQRLLDRRVVALPGQFRQADRPDYVVSDVDPVFAATLVIARRASAETDSEIATSC